MVLSIAPDTVAITTASNGSTMLKI
jgi:hypothetical protein